jgi:hypothetical protein
MYLAQIRQAAMNLQTTGGSSLVNTTKAQYASKTRELPLGQVFGKIDTNGDGVVSKEEFDQVKSTTDKEVAQALSSLKTGSTASFVSMLQGANQATTGASGTAAQDDALSSDRLFGNIDADGDGVITRDEFQNLGSALRSGGVSGGQTAAASSATGSLPTSSMKSSATNPLAAQQNAVIGAASQTRALMEQAMTQYKQLAQTGGITGSMGHYLFTG